MLDPTQEPEFFVSETSQHYRPQNYRLEWESHPSLSQWLAPGRNSKRARCTYCDVEMTADICVLKSHGKGARHKRRLRGETLTSSSRYNPGWESDPDYAEWVRPGRVKTRAECAFCDVEFAAETTVLKNHAKSKRHCRAASQAKRLAEMSRVWRPQKLLVDQCSNDILEAEKRRKNHDQTPSTQTSETCTLTVDEDSCSSFGLEDPSTVRFEVRNVDTEPEVNTVQGASGVKQIFNIDITTGRENEASNEAPLRVRSVMRSPNTLEMTIEDSSSPQAFDDCASLSARSGDESDEKVGAGSVPELESRCRLCQRRLRGDQVPHQTLCAACQDSCKTHDPGVSLEVWSPCEDEDSPLAAGGAEGRGPRVLSSVVPSMGTRSSSKPCVVQGRDLSKEVRDLAEVLRQHVGLLSARLSRGAHERQVLLRLDKVISLLNKIKKL